MKFYEKLFYHAAAYSVSVTLLFFAFAALMGVDDLSLSFGRFALIIAFGLVLSAAEFIFVANRIPRWAQYAIHFVVLALSFFAVFLTVRSSDGEFEFKAATVFAAIIIFAVFYFIGLGIVYIFRKALYQKSYKKLPAENKKSPSKQQKYEPRFKK